MICPACGTWNREAARFCKYCAARLEPTAAAERGPVPPPVVLAPPPAWRPRTWWHTLGVVAILGAFVTFIDLATDGQVTWALVAVLGLAFLAGGLLILRFLASPDRGDRRPFFTGAALLVAAVILLPVSLAFLGAATVTETRRVPFDPSIRNLNLDVSNDAGEVTVSFTDATDDLVRAEIVHVGGLFSSHFEGDVVVTDPTTEDTLSFSVTIRGVPGLFFAGGHHVHVHIQRNLSVRIDVQSTAANVAIDVPPGVAIRGISATVSATGNTALRSEDAVYANGATVRLASATGAVTIDVRQSGGMAGTASVAGTSTAGRVTFLFEPGTAVGAEVRASPPSGSVIVDTSKYEAHEGLWYAPSRAAFNGAGLKFIVQLATTTGSVVIG